MNIALMYASLTAVSGYSAWLVGINVRMLRTQRNAQQRLSGNVDKAIALLVTMMVLIAVMAVNADAQPAPPTGKKTGVLIMAHGGDAEWDRDVETVVAPLRATYPVEIAFGMAQTSSLRESVRRLEEKSVEQIAVVRMFISGDSFLEETEYILGLRQSLARAQHDHAAHVPPAANTANAGDPHAGHATPATQPAMAGHMMEAPQPIKPKAKILLSRAGISESPLIDQILADRVKDLSMDPSKESVLVLAHGPGSDEENERWLAEMNKRLEQVRKLGAFRAVRHETLREDWPEKRAPAEARVRQFVDAGNRDGGRVIVVPFRVSGFGPYARVLQGLAYVSDGRGLSPHPLMTRWIEQSVQGLIRSDVTANR